MSSGSAITQTCCSQACTAASKGHLNCLQFIHEDGRPWNERTPLLAAWNGHLDCLKYAYKNNCPWDERTPMFAALGGHPQCLCYAREHGCRWDSSNIVMTTFKSWNIVLGFGEHRGYLECLRYLYDNGCSWRSMSSVRSLDTVANNAHGICAMLFDKCDVRISDPETSTWCKSCERWANDRAATVSAILQAIALPMDLIGVIGDFTCELDF